MQPIFAERVVIAPQRLEALSRMFGSFKRRNDRKARLSTWFARERDGDMQAFDVQGLASGVGAWFDAVQRERTLRRTTRAAARIA
jgi:hypothetical protein